MEKAYLIPCYGIMGLEKKQNWFKEKAFLKGWFKNGGLEDQGLSFSKIKQSKGNIYIYIYITIIYIYICILQGK